MRGQIRRAHFRHRRDSICSYGKGETWQHEEAKLAILNGARERGLDASPEVDVLTTEGDRRADVLVWSPQKDSQKPADLRRNAFEVQYSSIDSDNIKQRTASYISKKIPIIWIPVVDAKKFKFIHTVGETNLFLARAYSMRKWISDIKYLHGHIWLYIPQTKGFWKGHATPHYRWREGKEWYNSEGEYQQTQSRWFAAAKEKDLFLEGPFRFVDLKIARVDMPEKSEIKFVDKKNVFIDLIAPNSSKFDGKRAEKILVEVSDCGYYYYYEDWVRIGADWRHAEVLPIECLPSLEPL